MIPQSFIQDLLARVDIVEVIERYLPLKKSGANYFACCPFHSEKSASFSVSPTKQFYYCFGCGAHGTAISFLMQYNGLGYPEAIEELARSIGMAVPSEGRAKSAQADERQALFERVARAAAFYREALGQAPAAIDYLRGRGLSSDIAARFGMGYAPNDWQPLTRVFADYQDKRLISAGLVSDKGDGKRHDFFRNRIMFPIHDRQGRVIAFGGRVLDDSKPKYLNSPQTPLFEKGRELYGLFLAQKAIRDAGFVLVVEGYMDVVALAQFGLENAVAPLGTATTAHHIQTLLRQTGRVVFCFDGDEAGRRAAWRALENALEALRDDISLAFLFLPPEHDPDTFVRSEGVEAFRHAAANATSLTDFLLDTLKTRCNPSSAEGRAHLVHEARPLVTRIPAAAEVLRLQLVKAIAQASQLTQGELEHALGLPLSSRPASTHHAGAFPQTRSRYPSRGAPRRAPPSTATMLLRLVLQHPNLAARLPIGLIPDDSAEGRALIAIIDLVDLGEAPGGLGALTERFRDTPHGEILAQVGASLIDTEFDAAVVEPLFEDTLKKLQADTVDQEIARLTEQARKVPLSPAEQHMLSELFREKHEFQDKTNLKSRSNI
ncbi:MAG: DNA primase [Azoarcus sp.]|jgi:DNA primase|nr:DNA primase [Azoarcus sp.]